MHILTLTMSKTFSSMSVSSAGGKKDTMLQPNLGELHHLKSGRVVNLVKSPIQEPGQWFGAVMEFQKSGRVVRFPSENFPWEMPTEYFDWPNCIWTNGTKSILSLNTEIRLTSGKFDMEEWGILHGCLSLYFIIRPLPPNSHSKTRKNLLWLDDHYFC